MAGGFAKTLLAAALLVSCAKAQEPALLPLPKQAEFTGGSIPAGAPETLSFVESIPEAVLNENEAYRLTVDKAGVHIEAVTEQGVWNARQTLRQLAQKGRIPCCRIVDWPSFRVRGWMMDVGRTYVSLEELKRDRERGLAAGKQAVSAAQRGGEHAPPARDVLHAGPNA